jgi:hypothetical protein
MNNLNQIIGRNMPLTVHQRRQNMAARLGKPEAACLERLA